MNPESERWLKQARRDLDNSQKNFDLGLWDVSVTLAQQGAEKALKALIVARTSELPPRWHDIRNLAAASGLLEVVPAESLKLSDYYISARYPDASSALPY